MAITSDADLKLLLECAEGAARAAGRHALNNLHRRREINAAGLHDVKLQLDVECQAAAVQAVRDAFPDHDVLGEEDDHDKNAPPIAGRLKGSPVLCPQSMGRHLWLIDPIDGTVNFSHGMPHWCCSVAVIRDDAVLAGAIYAPELDECYTATADTPTLLNGNPVSVSSTDALDMAMVRTGLDRNTGMDYPPFCIFEAVGKVVQRPRIMGSAALDMCHVACGQADGYIETGIYLWDVAAAGLIVNRAGGRAELLRHLQGGRLQYLATNGKLHEPLRKLVEEAIGA